MAKCTACGKDDRIVMSSLTDGNICYNCYQKLFRVTNGVTLPRLYDKLYFMTIVSNIDQRARQRLARTFKEIQSKYSYVITNFSVNNNIMVIELSTRYRRKNCYIHIFMDLITGMVQYALSYDNAEMNDIVYKKVIV